LNNTKGTAAAAVTAAAGIIAGYIFPPVCPVCGGMLSLGQGSVHRDCLDRLSFVRAPACSCCGRQIITGHQRLCYDCSHSPRHFIRNFPALNYDDTARRIIADLKYRNRRGHAAFLGRLMACCYREELAGAHIDCIVPVPISESRRRDRRYNQAELIADALGEELSLPVNPHILIRSKKTKAMKELGAGDRLTEIKNAIEAGDIPDGIKRVLIVDDIYTTGATMEACAYILWQKGIESYAACACIGSDY